MSWQAFFETILELVEHCRVRNIIHITSLHAATPHTRPVQPRGIATTHGLAEQIQVGYLADSEVYSETNPGIMDACIKRGVGYATLGV